MIHALVALAVAIIGGVLCTMLALYVRRNADRIEAALLGEPIRRHD
jgi:sensor c-di-GMP phosphodiesterase-like protein